MTMQAGRIIIYVGDYYASECDDLPLRIINIKFLKYIAHCLCYFKRNKNDGFTSIFSKYIVFIDRNINILMAALSGNSIDILGSIHNLCGEGL
jgi:hypothetical protein